MRILIVHNQLWAHYKAIIFNELQKIINQNNDDFFLVVQIASIEKSRMNLGDLDESIHQYPYKLLHKGFLEDVSLNQRIAGIIESIREFKPDVVNLTGYYDIASWIVLFYCKFKGIKTILSNETTSNDHKRNRIIEFVKGLIIKQFDGYFNFGTSSENYILSLGISPDKMLVKKSCVDNIALNEIYLEHLKNRTSNQQLLKVPSKNFIFVGRLIDYKNLFYFLSSFQIAQQSSNKNWGVIILGDGELKGDLQQYVAERKIENISFQKGVSWQQVPEYLALSNVLVLPSYSEPWGLVVNEAMACGLPVIVSKKCGCAIDLVMEGENGFTFNPSNPKELTNILLKFMQEKVDSDKMGLVSKKIIQTYSPQNVAGEIYSGFQKTFQK